MPSTPGEASWSRCTVRVSPVEVALLCSASCSAQVPGRKVNQLVSCTPPAGRAPRCPRHREVQTLCPELPGLPLCTLTRTHSLAELGSSGTWV